MVSLQAFKGQTDGNSYGKPRLDFPQDSWYMGECVSYVRRYMEDVQNVPSRTIGHAVSYWKHPYMLKYYEPITDGSRRDGDILVWGDDEGSWTGPEGHIGIAYGGRVLNQNYGGSGKVSINDFFAPGYLGALRLKGGDMPELVNLNTARILAAHNLARDGFDGRENAHSGASDADLNKHHVGKELTNQYIRDNFFASTEASRAFAIKEAVYRERDELRKLVDNAKPGEAEETLAQVREALKKVLE